MARPKTKSSLVDGIMELVEMLRGIDAKLNSISKMQVQSAPKKRRGRPPVASSASGSQVKRGPGRPPKKRRGRPAGSGVAKRRGRPPLNANASVFKKRRGRGRPPGSKNKK